MTVIKRYEKPVIEIIAFQCEDILTSSSGYVAPDPGNDGEWDMLDANNGMRVFG
ncbi:MAG: hypothetical protein IJS94_01610 [Clostridia bacterium]|nr:hypothetical protein [Clostridia bacterium]